MDLATNRVTAVLACSAGMAFAGVSAPVRAQTLPEVAAQIQDLRREMAAQRSLIDSQAQRLTEQQQEIVRLRQQLAAANNTEPRNASVAQSPPPPAATASASPAATLPPQPVGQAPEPAHVEQQVEAVPQGAGVLTRAGRFVLTPSLEFTNSSNERLVFRGIELIPGIQVGLIEASSANRNTLVAAGSVRYGLTDTLEVEASVPYLLRSDRVEVMQQREDSTSQVTKLRGDALGDIELGLRYQLNRPVGERPIFVSSLRIKTDTGRSPYSISFDEFGIATGLATGSGFWAIQPGLSFLLPTDPAVIFGGIGYLYQLPRTVNKSVGEVTIGRVKPGNAISGNIGFGFSLNQRFSYSLGYRHNYISSTRTHIGDVLNRSTPLHVGTFTMGMSYRLTPQQSLDFGLELGATENAPDVSLTFRAPFTTR